MTRDAEEFTVGGRIGCREYTLPRNYLSSEPCLAALLLFSFCFSLFLSLSLVPSPLLLVSRTMFGLRSLLLPLPSCPPLPCTFLLLWSCSLPLLFCLFLSFFFSLSFFCLRRLFVLFACWCSGLARVSLASFFVVLWGPPLFANVGDLQVLSLWLTWGLCLSHFPLLLLRTALG